MTRKVKTPTVGNYEPTGRCGICVLHIEAIQPGGKAVRHVHDKTPLCREKSR